MLVAAHSCCVCFIQNMLKEEKENGWKNGIPIFYISGLVQFATCIRVSNCIELDSRVSGSVEQIAEAARLETNRESTKAASQRIRIQYSQISQFLRLRERSQGTGC